MKNDKWDARIRRANRLASVYPFAAEGLSFYARVAQFQKSLYADLAAETGAPKKTRLPGTLRADLDLFFLLPRFAPFLALIAQEAPALLSQSASELRAQNSERWGKVLRAFWEASPDPPANLTAPQALLAWIFLVPYAESLADFNEWPTLSGTPSLCPRCGCKPLVGVLRPEGDGAKRSLICALCATEWEFRRIVCPACGEEDVHKLAVYTAPEFSHVRVEACDTCRHYIKSVDLTKDGHALPVVDELATIPLNLWAQEHAYVKLQTNLLGI